MGPNTPLAIGQDPTVALSHMGDYDQFAVDGTSAFDAAWADNWSSSGFHANSGTGANDCNNLNAGGSTHFLNSATVPVAAGVAPFGGSFLPE